MKDEQHIIHQARLGDPQAFQALIERYQKLVMHVVFRMILDPRDREELAQDVFIKVHRNLHLFRSESKLSTWIARIAYNTCLNHLSKKQLLLYADVMPERKEGVETPMEDCMRDRDESPEDQVITNEMKARVHTLIEQLPLPYRTVLTLYYLAEMPVKEVGAVMSLPVGTVKSYLFRARRRLKENLISQNNREASLL